MKRGPGIHGTVPAVLFGMVLLLVLAVACERQGDTGQDGPPDGATGMGAGGTPPGERPNVVLILADDLDRAVFEGSTLDAFWETEGVSFTNAQATTSLCCPSRASILTGRYAHNTGLVNNHNEEPGGGARFFRESGLEDRTLATILHDSGYETWFGGKYLNGYEEAGGWQGRVPPGWDNWQAYLSPLTANEDGTVADMNAHYTDWLAGTATRFVEGQEGSSKPFFMQISTWDTHEPLTAPPRHRGAYAGRQAPRPPSFNEADVSDKPDWVGGKAPLSLREIKYADRRHAARLRSALTLEDLNRAVLSALSRAGELEDTYLIFTSDNGFHMGLHRMRGVKWTPYTEAHEVPFVVRGPNVPRGRSFDDLVANTDIAPTVLDLAGLAVPDGMDGRTFAPFLDGRPPDAWRSSLLVEGTTGPTHYRPGYSGVRREDEIYVEYANGEKEYYDLNKDPYQLRNRPEAAPKAMAKDLQALKTCAGKSCRQAENP